MFNITSAERRDMKTLKEIREAKGIKQIAVANHLGVVRQTYANYEANPQDMSVDQARAVCDFLGCDLSDIFLIKDVN